MRKRSNVFEFFKSSKEKREEQISAYIDQQMSGAERQSFETLLANDADLREQVEAGREAKALLSQMPKLKAPRNFVLDPAVYGGKAPAPSLLEMLYPKMRLATAAAAFLFVIVFGAGVLLPGATMQSAPESAAGVALVPTQTVDPNLAFQVGVPEEAAEEVAEMAEAEVAEVQPTIVLEAEDAEMSNYADLAEDEAVMSESAVAADEAPQMQAADSAEAGAVAESLKVEEDSDDALIESPRAAEPEPIEGERLSEPEPLPTPTIAIAQDEVAVIVDDGSVQTENQNRFGVVEPSPPVDWLSISLWVLGVLTAVLVVGTLIIGRRVD